MSKKKIIVTILICFAAFGLLLAMIPIEKKRLLVEEYGVLAEQSFTDERAAHIIEVYDTIPEIILNRYYLSDEHDIEEIYDYLEHKDDYLSMSFTAEELNSETIPSLYMDDNRWAYQEFEGGYIFNEGCAAVSLTMANLYLNHNDSVDPVKAARAAERVGNIGYWGGISNEYMVQLCNEVGLNAEEYNYSTEENGKADFEIIKNAIDNGNVVMAGMVGDTFGGHALVIKDYNENGEIFINDPASEDYTNRAWDFNDLQPEMYFIWVLSK